jgi:hypothetical protein
MKIEIHFPDEELQPLVGAFEREDSERLTEAAACQCLHTWVFTSEPVEPTLCNRTVWLNPGWRTFPEHRLILCPDCAAAHTDPPIRRLP